jgi:hypothetical protein
MVIYIIHVGKNFDDDKVKSIQGNKGFITELIAGRGQSMLVL